MSIAMRTLEKKSAMNGSSPAYGSAVGIPERYGQVAPEQVVLAHEALKCEAAAWLDGTNKGWPGFLIYGGLGVGKTSLAIEFMRDFAAGNRYGLFETLWHMVAVVKSTWGEGGERGELEAIADFVKPDLLVVDEVGVQFGTVAERNILYAVVVSRYNKCKPTILTTNCMIDTEAGLQEFWNSVGSRVADRFQGYDINASKWGKNLRVRP